MDEAKGVKRIVLDVLTFGQYELWQYFINRRRSVNADPTDEKLIEILINLKKSYEKKGKRVIIERSRPAVYNGDKYHFVTVVDDKSKRDILGILILDDAGALVSDENLAKENIKTQLARSVMVSNELSNNFPLQKINGNLDKLNYAMDRIALINRNHKSERIAFPAGLMSSCDDFAETIEAHKSIIGKMLEIENNICDQEGPKLGLLESWKELKAKNDQLFYKEIEIIRGFVSHKGLAILGGRDFNSILRAINENIVLMEGQIKELNNTARYIHDSSNTYLGIWKNGISTALPASSSKR